MLALAWFIYRPGLSGDFLFDDFVNLNALGSGGAVDNWRTFWRYITSGTADPAGRPLALLSFLIDARDWPADPAPFLRTNVLLHLVNGALLFALLRRLGHALDSSDRFNDAAALLASSLWIAHPLLVSTTLYAVQREAMLPATFTLLGLLAYSVGRTRFANSGGNAGLAWMVSGIGLGTLLAVLSKANGVLLPLLAWVLEATIFNRLDADAENSFAKLRPVKLVLLVLPSLAVLAYVASFLSIWNVPLGIRPWTVGERVLTEPRVLIDYLQLLIVPRSVSTGLFNDAYVFSQNLWRPWTTAPSMALIVALLIAGVRLRKRLPSFSAAVLFWLAGHLLESTSLPLELYFEHRNYLPAMLFFWPLSRALWRWQRPLSMRALVAASLVAIFAITTYQRTELWGQPQKMAALWALQNPGSSRAQSMAAIVDTQGGRTEQALRRLAPLWNQRPYDLQIAFNFMDARCSAKGPSVTEKRALADALRHTDTSALLTHVWLGAAIDAAVSNACPGLTVADVETWIQSALENPVINQGHVRDQDIEPLLAQIALIRKEPDKALLHFNRALRSNPVPDIAARQAALLASSDYFEAALAHLDLYEQLRTGVAAPGYGMPLLHAKVLEWQGYWPHEMAVLRSKLHAAIDESSRPLQ